jgi:hypothetical protein
MSNDEKERELRNRIWESPSLLPGFDAPAAAAKEVPVRRAGSADVVVVDAEGKIAIVECKRAANPECRRWVIGQVLEYAAGLWKLEYEDFERLLAARGTALTKPFKDVPGWDGENFRSAVSRNLGAGAFQLIIAVDEMTESLKKKLNRAVVFLNCHTQPDVGVLAVALPRGAPPGEVYGEDCEGVGPLKPKLKPDRWTLMDEISSPDATLVAEDLLDWADSREPRGVRVDYPKERIEGIVRAPRGNLFRLRPREVRVSLSSVIGPGEAWDGRTEQLVQDLDDIGVVLVSKRPRAPLELLADEGRRKEFLALMERHLGTLTG